MEKILEGLEIKVGVTIVSTRELSGNSNLGKSLVNARHGGQCPMGLTIAMGAKVSLLMLAVNRYRRINWEK